MDVTIRDAVPEDVDVIVGLLIESKIGSFGSLISEHDKDVAFWTARWTGYVTEGSRAQQSLGDGWAFLAEHDGVPVGFAAYHHTTRHQTDAELQAIYVLKESQGLGVGTALLRVVAGRLTADGSRSMCVGYWDESPYRHFYAKHGAESLNPHWSVWWDVPALAERLRPDAMETAGPLDP